MSYDIQEQSVLFCIFGQLSQRKLICVNELVDNGRKSLLGRAESETGFHK